VETPEAKSAGTDSTTDQGSGQEPQDAPEPEAQDEPQGTNGNDATQATPFSPSVRDPRLPAVGSVITRSYKGMDLKVLVTETGFQFRGTNFSSLSKLAKTLSGHQAVNGFAFFKLGTGGKAKGPGCWRRSPRPRRWWPS
jgi:hypothetical protein